MLPAWSSSYKGTLRNKAIFKKLWNALPKYLCWKIWLTRNRAIFNQILAKPKVAMAKAKGLLAEHINSKLQLLTNVQLLDKDEEVWYEQFEI
jgi:hypothetical protein